jgi:hypothetical protein
MGTAALSGTAKYFLAIQPNSKVKVLTIGLQYILEEAFLACMVYQTKLES